MTRAAAQRTAASMQVWLYEHFHLAGKPKSPFQRTDWVIASSVAIALLIPAGAWIAIDNSPFGGDQSEYATRTLILFRTLVESPSRWVTLMATGDGFRPPGIEWVGQFFVPLGYLIGSVDKALLYSVLAIQFISLMLLFRAIWEMTDGDTLTATLGALLLAAAPIFVGSSQNYMVEPLQVLAVTWLLLILARARDWSRALIVGQLMAAGTLAMLAKASSPLYCVVPALVAVTFVFRPARSRELRLTRDRAALSTMILTVPVSMVCLSWYLHNYRAVLAHASGSSFGRFAAVWGKEDTFLNSLAYWLGILLRGLFSNTPTRFLIYAILSGGVLYLVIRTKDFERDHRAVLVAAIQLAVTLAAFALASNRLHRFALPLLPYGAVLLSLIVAAVNRRILTGLVILVVAYQFLDVHAQKLGMIRPTRAVAEFVRRIDRDGRSLRTIDSIVERTCRQSDHGVVNVLAIDAVFKGRDWLAPVPANYVVRKHLATGTQAPPCNYMYVGNSFFGSSATDAWNHILSTRVRYVIIADPAVYPPSASAMNQTLNPENAPVVLNQLRNSGSFNPPTRLPEDPGILIFERAVGSDRAITSDVAARCIGSDVVAPSVALQSVTAMGTARQNIRLYECDERAFSMMALSLCPETMRKLAFS